MQLIGQIVAQEDQIGVVQSTGTATLNQPDKVLLANGVEVDRTPQPQLEVQSVHVKWEDGEESTLVEHLDQWIVLGTVIELPAIKGDVVPPGANAELPEQAEEVAAVDVGKLADDLRALPPVEHVTDAELRIVDDGALTIAD